MDVVEHVRSELAAIGVGAAEQPLLVMFSGGGDSTALLLSLHEITGGEGLAALHVNYGLRGDQSTRDAEFCRELCTRLGVPLTLVEAEPAPSSGNLQDWARNLRYAAAEAAADTLGSAALIVVAHTADDQAETALYRLFASPGRRALRGMPARRGRIVRPLLALRREELREWLKGRGEGWREDASNDDPRFVRTRARRLLAAAEELHPAALANLLRTVGELREEGDELAAVVDGLLSDLTTDDDQLDLDALAELPAALARAVLRDFVELRRARPVPQAAGALEELLRLGAGGEQRELQVEGARIAVQRGRAWVIEPV